MKSGVKNIKEIQIVRAELEIEIGDTQYLIDTNTDIAKEMAYVNMVRLQQVLKKNKKTRTSVKLGIKNKIRTLKSDIASPPNENDPKYYKENWLVLVQMAEEKIKEQQQLL